MVDINNYGCAGAINSVINFKFNDVAVLFRVEELRVNKHVRWRHSGIIPEAWCDTEIAFDLEKTVHQVYVNFSHQNWKESSKFMAHCSTKWAVFLLSLKDAIEKNCGHPFPDDVHIDHDE